MRKPAYEPMRRTRYVDAVQDWSAMRPTVWRRVSLLRDALHKATGA
jgi:hypothetical protein